MNAGLIIGSFKSKKKNTGEEKRMIFLLVWLIYDAILGNNNTSKKILAVLAVLYGILSLIFTTR